jgi:formamidopyrimidine-DNA glycosylase
MPELPEVDLVARQLEKSVAGRSVERAVLIRAKLAPSTTPRKFSSLISGSQITSIARRGKFILLHLSNDLTLIVHLRMSGRFMLLEDGDADPKFAHAIFYFSDGQRLIFDDQRHFGLMKPVRTRSVFGLKEISRLAPEPFSDGFNVGHFRSTLKASRRSLKELLIDQTKVLGLGNIYAAEALFAAGIHPSVRSHKVSKPKANKLHQAILEVLGEALELASQGPFDPKNMNGSYSPEQGRWRVYGREGEECGRCGSPIKRIVHAGRSTYFCAVCQKS